MKMACVTIFCEVCEVDAAIITRTVNLEDEYYDVIISETKLIVATPGGAVHTTGVVETHDTGTRVVLTLRLMVIQLEGHLGMPSFVKARCCCQ